MFEVVEMADARQVLVEDNESTSFETTPGVEVLNTFDGMGLRQDLMRGIYAYGTWFHTNKNSLIRDYLEEEYSWYFVTKLLT